MTEAELQVVQVERIYIKAERERVWEPSPAPNGASATGTAAWSPMN